MTRRTVYEHKESGMYIVYRVYWQGNYSQDMSGEYEYCGRTRIKRFDVYTKSGEKIKSISMPGIREKNNKKDYYYYLSLSQGWLHTFYYRSMYIKPVMCNSVNGQLFNGIYCPYLILRQNEASLCNIKPNAWGYGGGPGYQRPLPDDLKCDMNKWPEAVKMLQSEIGSFFFTFNEYHICASGEGRKMIEREPVKEDFLNIDLKGENNTW